jgi:hypothetical protein
MCDHFSDLLKIRNEAIPLIHLIEQFGFLQSSLHSFEILVKEDIKSEEAFYALQSIRRKLKVIDRIYF